MFGCFVGDSSPTGGSGRLTINFTFPDPTGGGLVSEKCVDNKGTLTFQTSATAETSGARTRTGIACLDGAVVAVEETLTPATDFALSDAQLEAPTEASVAMAEQARSLTP